MSLLASKKKKKKKKKKIWLTLFGSVRFPSQGPLLVPRVPNLQSPVLELPALAPVAISLADMAACRDNNKSRHLLEFTSATQSCYCFFPNGLTIRRGFTNIGPLRAINAHIFISYCLETEAKMCFYYVDM